MRPWPRDLTRLRGTPLVSEMQAEQHYRRRNWRDGSRDVPDGYRRDCRHLHDLGHNDLLPMSKRELVGFGNAASLMHCSIRKEETWVGAGAGHSLRKGSAGRTALVHRDISIFGATCSASV